MLAIVQRVWRPILLRTWRIGHGGLGTAGHSLVRDVNAIANLDFAFYFALFRRRLPLFLGVLVVAAAILVAATTFWPVSYQATARLLVESPQIPIDLAKSTVPTGTAEQFQIIQEDVLSRQSLLALSRRFGLHARKPLLTDNEIVTDMQTRLGIMPTPIGTGSGTTATVFQISFKWNQPAVAANVVNDMVSSILKKDVELRTDRATETLTFFNKETARLSAALAVIDENILSFKNQHIDALPDSIDYLRTQKTNHQDRLLVLTQEEAGLRKRQIALQSRPLDFAATPVTPDQQMLQSLRQLLVQQQASFTETSPTIVALRARIARLEASMMEANAAAETDEAQSMTTQGTEIFDIRERLDEIANERAQINAALTLLNSSIAATPGIETTLNSLEREHQNLQAQYDSTVARLAEASTGQQIELLLKGERLSLIESAVPPQKSQGPGQKTLLIGSALAALALALVAVIIPELLNRRIRRPAELISRLQIVPYITVPYVERRVRPTEWIGRALGRTGSRFGKLSQRASWKANSVSTIPNTRHGA
jgi:succinoglycan biosynthesis transport protein ExoP